MPIEIASSFESRPITSLRSDILNWRAHLYDICPKLHEFLDDATIPDETDEINLCLPSSFTAADRVKYGLQRHAACELQLRKGEGYDIIRNLRTAIRVISQFEYKSRKGKKGQSTKTRASRPYVKAFAQREHWKKEYITVRELMLNLGLSESDATFRPLTDKDMYRPEHLEGVEFGSGSKEVGWLWTVSLNGYDSSDTKLGEWLRDGSCFHFLPPYSLTEFRFSTDARLQWIRQLAARDRWREEVEMLEEELKRLARGSSGFANAWRNIALRQNEAGKLGQATFASKKELSSRVVAFNAVKTCIKLGIEWDSDKEPNVKETKVNCI